MSNPELTYSQRLRQMNALTESLKLRVIRKLHISPDAQVLDAGCGIGSHTVWIRQQLGENGRAVGLDQSADHLAIARAMGEDICWVKGDLKHLPFDDASFDLVWCADVLWPGVFPSVTPVLKELCRVLRPGGQIALLYWLDQALISGHPILEAKLRHAMSNAMLYFNVPAEQQAAHARGWFQSAGLGASHSEALIHEITGPVDNAARAAIRGAIDMLYNNVASQLPAHERDILDSFQADAEAYFGWIVFALHVGVKTG